MTPAGGPRVVHCKRESFDVYIGRPSVWGNPFAEKPTPGTTLVASRDEAIARYRAHLAEHPELVERARRELRGKVLGCWCAPKACHGDVLLEIANA
jgi:hypothetical protein